MKQNNERAFLADFLKKQSNRRGMIIWVTKHLTSTDNCLRRKQSPIVHQDDASNSTDYEPDSDYRSGRW